MDTKTGTLTDFLLARISEDEASARRLFQFLDGPAEPPTWIAAKPAPDAEPGRVWSRPGTVWDSARVLAECEAKRRIVDVVFSYEATIDGEWGCCHSADEIRAGACEDRRPDNIAALLLLALPYADHPDYRDEWRA